MYIKIFEVKFRTSKNAIKVENCTLQLIKTRNEPYNMIGSQASLYPFCFSKTKIAV